ncbi:MAG: glycoside hydrolase family 30 protein [Clostridia bacterium]|nr:glycoside hydrolase family 30 protein [Clostridia bacterium]
MFITSTENNYWQNGKETEKEGYKLTFGNEVQTIRGFGTCFSELSALALNELSAKDKKLCLDELFDHDKCNFNFCRTPIGSSDFATSFYSYNEVDKDYEMKNFSIERDEELLLPLIMEGVDRQKDLQMFASPWCPPLWLKTHRAYSHGVFNHTEENLQAYALYFRKYVEAYLEKGVPLTFIAPQNEPCSNQVFPSCVWTGAEMANFIGGYLGRALEGTGVSIMFGTINGPETDDRYLRTRFCDYLGIAMMDENARKYIKAVGYQWAGKYALVDTCDNYPDLEIIQTESECGDGNNTWAQMMYIFELVRQYFRFGASAYVYWNLALHEKQPSTWGWRQNSLITVKDGRATFTPEFYLMKHMSHFVQRGARYVMMKGEFSSNCVTFKNPDGSYVLLVANPYKEKKIITVSGSSYELPARSINTITF